jgi:hypothetical protein
MASTMGAQFAAAVVVVAAAAVVVVADDGELVVVVDPDAGGVMIFLCGGGGQPNCPASTSGTITGTITPANVVGPTAQGINAGDLAAALEAVHDGESYVNIHNARFPAGEMRGQLRRGERGRD